MEGASTGHDYLTAMVIAVPLSVRPGIGSVLGAISSRDRHRPFLGLSAPRRRTCSTMPKSAWSSCCSSSGWSSTPRLWSMRRSWLGVGGAQILLSTARHRRRGQRVRLPLAPRAVGITLALSSTAIVSRPDEKDLMRTEAAGPPLGVLTQDIAVIPALAILPLLAVQPASGAPKTARSSAAMPMMAITPCRSWRAFRPGRDTGHAGGRHRRDPRRPYLSADPLPLHPPQPPAAGCIPPCAGHRVRIALLMILVGLSPAPGAFVAGVALPIPISGTSIEADIEPFKGLLLGLFFTPWARGSISARSSCNPLMILGLTLGLMALKASSSSHRPRVPTARRRQVALYARAGAGGRIRLRAWWPSGCSNR